MSALANLLNRLAARPRWCTLGLGALAALGFEPLHLWPLTLLALAGLIELIARAGSWKQAALIGWLFGIGHFTIGNGWIATAFTYQANMPAWLGWIAVVALSLYLAVYPALAVLAAWLAGRLPPSPSGEGPGVEAVRQTHPDPTTPTPTPPLKGRGSGALVCAFAATWIIAEWLRSWVFTGFVWNPLGMTALGTYSRPGLASLAPWLGTYALSGLVVLLAGAWLIAWHRRRIDWRGGALVVLPAALMLMPGGGEAARPGRIPFSLIQPNIPQEVLNEPAEFENNFVQTALPTMQRPPGERLVLWPESGVQDYLRDGYPPSLYWDTTYGGDPALARERLTRVAGKGGLLLTGAIDLEVGARELTGARNVVTAIDSQGAIRGSYAKAHLVPYGEYLPMRALLEPLGASRLVPGSLDFLAGPGPRTLDLGRFGKAGVQICYEIIFSGQVVDRNHRPDYIFNPSNDGWFGSWGPPQHLAQARMRAIEEGLPVLRATTTGISAVIDAGGVVRQHLGRGSAGRLDGMIPPARAPTLFAQAGNWLPLGWAAILLGLSLVASRRRRG